jgi:hypothetical protein
MPDNVKRLIRENNSIKQVLFDAYLEWKVAVTNLDNLDDAEKQLIAKQEQVWRALGVTDDFGKAGKLRKIALGSDDMSRFAVNFRKTLSMPNHRGNVVVFEYVDNNGNPVKKVFTTEIGNQLHAEKIADTWFDVNKIPKQNVKRIYSELEPCELEESMCKQMLENNFPTASKMYSYPYPGGNNSIQDIIDIRRLSIQERANDLENLLK